MNEKHESEINTINFQILMSQAEKQTREREYNFLLQNYKNAKSKSAQLENEV